MLIPPASPQVRAHCARRCTLPHRVDTEQKHSSVQVFYTANPTNSHRVRCALPQSLHWRGWMRSREEQGLTLWQIPLAGAECFRAGQPFPMRLRHLGHCTPSCGAGDLGAFLTQRFHGWVGHRFALPALPYLLLSLLQTVVTVLSFIEM